MTRKISTHDGIIDAPDLVPALDVEPVPTVVTMRQARVYLIRQGMLDAVNAQVEALGAEAVATWEYSQTVERDNAVLQLMGYTDEQLDTMFTEAAKL